MFYQVINQCAQALHQIEIWLDKAESHAKAKKYDVNILMTSRLAPDQNHFINQVQFGGDYVKYGAARLSGQAPPSWEDNEKTIEDVRARIQKTIAFAQSIKEEQYEGAADRLLEVNWAPGKKIRADDYLLQLTIPNVYFHVTTAYAILRHNGVDVGKGDFLGFVALS
jgi:hypothetical protein